MRYSNVVKDVVSGTSPDTSSKDTYTSWDGDVRDEEPRERPLTRSIACASSFTTHSPVPSSEDQSGQEDQSLRFVTNYCGSSKPPVLVPPKRIASSAWGETWLQQLSAEDHCELHCPPQWDALPTIFAPLPNVWTHEPVHAVDCRSITTSWIPWSPQEERWRDV
jgi:hypothetical protein